ncbi:hypothetical protein [Pseudomonas sp. NFX15]|uniref:hypothetical protein n=1 Tax=Pseudomonas sp. NFX15 TaxID=2816958 RepID=UPI003B8AFBC8
MMNYTNVLTPQWTNADHTAVNVVLVTEALGDIPFTATPNDSTSYGPEIYERVVAGEFGEIAAPPSEANTSPEAKARIEQLWVKEQLAQAEQEICKHEDQDPQASFTEQAWRTYRVELRAWPRSELFPNAEDRPTAPDGQQP